MARGLAAAALFTFLFSSSIFAQDIPTCDPDNKCPEEAPCCSAYGQCGIGAYCLGGCDPFSSNSLESCMPAPACKSEEYKLDSVDRIASNEEYLGDPDSANWVSSGKPVEYQDGILLTMAPDTVGTVLASTNYVWYGKVSATMTTSQGAGVVTAFILMSDVKDEIDFESVGADVDNIQSNFFALGVTDYTRSENLTTSNTFQNEHTYTIDWQPDSITWSIDGEERRKVSKDDYYNETSKTYDFPQTPSRVMLSVWPAGLPSNGEGTIEWAGGLVDWDSEYMQNGYYYALVKDVTVECYDPPSGIEKSGDTAYIYTDESGTEGSVAMVDKDTTLASLKATGEEPDLDPAASRSAAAAAASEDAESENDDDDEDDEEDEDEEEIEAESVPGLSGAGERSEQVGGTSSSSSNSDDEDGDGGSGGQGGGADDEDDDGTGGISFTQGGGSTEDDGAEESINSAPTERAGRGSMFAVVVAVLGLLVL